MFIAGQLALKCEKRTVSLFFCSPTNTFFSYVRFLCEIFSVDVSYRFCIVYLSFWLLLSVTKRELHVSDNALFFGYN